MLEVQKVAMTEMPVVRQTPQLVELTPKEQRLLYYLRSIAYGSVTVFIQGKQPIRVERALESITL